MRDFQVEGAVEANASFSGVLSGLFGKTMLCSTNCACWVMHAEKQEHVQAEAAWESLDN